MQPMSIDEKSTVNESHFFTMIHYIIFLMFQQDINMFYENAILHCRFQESLDQLLGNKI
jgi:hypothetical protein